MEYKYDFAFGDTRGLREMTLKNHFNFPMESMLVNWNKHGGYAPHEGDPALLIETRKLIKDLTGKDYLHVLITAGATNALNAYLYTKKIDVDFQAVYTNKLYYRMYPQIIENQGMVHYRELDGIEEHDIRIIDSPANPIGDIIADFDMKSGHNKVWDAAYYSPTYYNTSNNGIHMPKVFPKHDAMVGSFSKLTSINGIRVGWLATNDFDIYNQAFKYVQGDSCSVNSIGQQLLTKFLKTVYMDKFYLDGNRLLNDNRTELSRLSYLIGGNAIAKNGMFAFAQVDESMIKLFDKASVKFTDGATLGADYLSVRINMANTREETKEMVSAILKADGY